MIGIVTIDSPFVPSRFSPLSRLLLGFMVTDRAARGCAKRGMATREMASYAADNGTLDATAGLGGWGQVGKDEQRRKGEHETAH